MRFRQAIKLMKRLFKKNKSYRKSKKVKKD